MEQVEKNRCYGPLSVYSEDRVYPAVGQVPYGGRSTSISTERSQGATSMGVVGAKDDRRIRVLFEHLSREVRETGEVC